MRQRFDGQLALLNRELINMGALCEEAIAKADYILPYSASLHKDNFYTCQFHPEKSGKVGEQILKNFLEIK